MHYVIGDIHGQGIALRLLLNKIQYNPKADTLCFVGDYVDWGKDSIDVIRLIIKLQKESEKVIALMGNHDLMMLDAIKHPWTMAIPFRFFNNWFYNKGFDTMKQYMALNDEEKAEIREWIKSLPIDASFEINGAEYLITHSVPLSSIKHLFPWYPKKKKMEEAVWYELDDKTKKQSNQIVAKGITLVRGHRITDSLKIEHWNNGIINIDCGAKAIGYDAKRDYKLACICLETKNAFYVNADEVAISSEAKGK